MIFDLTWHGPVKDVQYAVEADTQEEAIERFQLWLCDPDDNERNDGVFEHDARRI